MDKDLKLKEAAQSESQLVKYDLLNKCEAIAESFERGAKWQSKHLTPQPSDWISVEDYEPLYNEDVIFYSSKYRMIRGGRVDNGAIVFCGARYIIGLDVTHWMKLPAPPTNSKTTEG